MTGNLYMSIPIIINFYLLGRLPNHCVAMPRPEKFFVMSRTEVGKNAMGIGRFELAICNPYRNL